MATNLLEYYTARTLKLDSEPLTRIDMRVKQDRIRENIFGNVDVEYDPTND